MYFIKFAEDSSSKSAILLGDVLLDATKRTFSEVRSKPASAINDLEIVRKAWLRSLRNALGGSILQTQDTPFSAGSLWLLNRKRPVSQQASKIGPADGNFNTTLRL